jgi:hypothetical protein
VTFDIELPGGRYSLLEAMPWASPTRRVYRARDGLTGGEVAVKHVPAALVRRELTALMAARLPGVVELLDHWVDGDRAAIVTRWVDGEPFPGASVGSRWSRLARPTLGLLDVVDRLHRCGVIHRDLKPTNVLVDRRGAVVVLDLGIAGGAGVDRRPDDLDVSGTLRYAAPEQLLGAVDPRSDLYAIGVMVYEALSGGLPHDGADLLGARLLEPAVPLASRVPDVPAEVARAVDRLLCTRPDDRFSDAREAARALGAAAATRYLPPGRPSRASLRRLLQGPERVAHLPTRAADLLWQRTGGRRARLEDELGEWMRSGVVDGALRLEPARFESLASAERGAALLRALRDHSSAERVAHALAESERADQRGEHLHAVAVLRAALATEVTPDEARALVTTWEIHALALGTPVAREDLLLAVRRLGDPELAPVERVLEAAGHVARGEAERALAHLAELDTLGAHLVRQLAARVGTTAAHREAVARFERWAEGLPPEVTDAKRRRAPALAANARGLLAYREGAYRDAVTAHLRAARTMPVRSAALAARLNAVAALNEIPDPRAAVREAATSLRAAQRLRHPGHEAFAEVLLRGATYRTGAVTHVDVELVDALEALALWPLAALAALTEASIAWRQGDERARVLAERAERDATATGRRPTAALAGALRQVVAGHDPERATALATTADELPRGVAAQVLALLAHAAPDGAPLRERARALAPWSADPDVRREILTPAEVRSGEFA